MTLDINLPPLGLKQLMNILSNESGQKGRCCQCAQKNFCGGEAAL